MVNWCIDACCVSKSGSYISKYFYLVESLLPPDLVSLQHHVDILVALKTVSLSGVQRTITKQTGTLNRISH